MSEYCGLLLIKFALVKASSSLWLLRSFTNARTKDPSRTSQTNQKSQTGARAFGKRTVRTSTAFSQKAVPKTSRLK